MKFLCILLNSCTLNTSLTVQEKSKSSTTNSNLRGTWTMFELCTITGFNSITGLKVQKTSEELIKANCGIINYILMDDGKYKQTCIKPGESEEKLYYEGLWKIQDNKLFLITREGGKDYQSEYTFEIKGDTLVLSRTVLDGKVSMITSFRRK